MDWITLTNVLGKMEFLEKSSFIWVFTEIFGHFDPYGVANNEFLKVDPLGCELAHMPLCFLTVILVMTLNN